MRNGTGRRSIGASPGEHAAAKNPSSIPDTIDPEGGHDGEGKTAATPPPSTCGVVQAAQRQNNAQDQQHQRHRDNETEVAANVFVPNVFETNAADLPPIHTRNA